MIGLPIKHEPGQFVQDIIEAYLLDRVPTDESSIASFSTAEKAQRAIEDLSDSFSHDENPAIYKVVISRLEGKEREGEE